jgi:thioredoxin reductase (NADPH)
LIGKDDKIQVIMRRNYIINHNHVNTPRGLPITSSSIEKIFPTLNPPQLTRIAARGHIRAMKDGEILYEQGRSAVPFFVVISGEIEVVRS